MTTTDGGAALAISALTTGYGRSTVLRDVALTVPAGGVAALLGPNGAGKTTLLRAAAGFLPARSGSVHVDGVDVTRKRPHERAKAGVCLIPEGRGVFPSLTVHENLRLQIPPWRAGAPVEPALAAFPVLRDRLDQVAGSLSGGQQQMVALSRCFLAAPRVVLLDEVSMGLAPRVVDEIFAALRRLTADGVSVLLVEQYVGRALELADVVHLLGRGAVTHSGPADEIDERELMSRYVGTDLDAEAASPGPPASPTPPPPQGAS